MATVISNIEAVRSLRTALRNPTISIELLSSIELIHSCIKSGTDMNGWKRIDWRGGLDRNHNKGSHAHSRHGATGGSGGGGKYSNSGVDHSAFNSRSKSGAATGTSSKHIPTSSNISTSIPLIAPVTVVAAGGAGASITSPASASASAPVHTVESHTKHTSYTSHKYVSKFKKATDKVEDTILNTILLGKLNKFSEVNYDEIKEFITHIIDNGETDMIKCFMKLVFEKAASEEIFCPLYAKLLSELSASYPVLLTEMANLYVQYMAIFEEVKEDEAESYNEFCKRNVEQKYRRGYSQFLAELTKHSVIDSDTFMKTVMKIINQIDINIKKKESLKLIEEYADCLMRIMRAIKPLCTDDSLHDSDDRVILIRIAIKSDLSAPIRSLTVKNTENVGVSNKARFTFLDIYEDIQKF
jgi:hypothetical protein